MALSRPKFVNNAHFSTGSFPEVLAFCDREISTHIVNGDEESYEYTLGYKTIYMVKKKASRWEVLEFDSQRVIRVSTASNLGVVLFQALSFSEVDRVNQEKRTNILIPINKADKEKTMAIMYYLGGYPGSFLPTIPELQIITEKFLEPDLDFLAYSYVPIDYIDWLREEMKNSGILGEGKNRNIWIYKK